MLMVLVVTMRVRVGHSVVGVGMTVLGARRRLILPRVGMLVMRVIMRMLMRVGKRVVLMGMGMLRHGRLLPV